MDKTAGNNDIIFRTGDVICQYNGQVINAQQRTARYGNKTAPYSVEVNNTCSIDSACKRGVGSIASNNAGNNNAKLAVDRTNKRASLKATKTIRNNTEIFLSYSSSYIMHQNGVYHTTK